MNKCQDILFFVFVEYANNLQGQKRPERIHHATLHYTTLHYTTLHYTTLHYTTLHHTTLHVCMSACLHVCLLAPPAFFSAAFSPSPFVLRQFALHDGAPCARNRQIAFFLLLSVGGRPSVALPGLGLARSCMIRAYPGASHAGASPPSPFLPYLTLALSVSKMIWARSLLLYIHNTGLLWCLVITCSCGGWDACA